VLAEEDFPEGGDERRGISPSNLGDWVPGPPPGADQAEWQHVLWRGLFHLPVYRGPVLRQPNRFPSKTMPKPPTVRQ